MDNMINKLTNANVYINGTSYLGRAEEVTMPTIKVKMSEHKTIAMMGPMEYPSGIEKADCKISWASLYPEALGIAGNTFSEVNLEIKASLEEYVHTDSEDSIKTEKKVHLILNGRFVDFPMGSFKPGEDVKFETNISVYHAKMIVDDKAVFEVDVKNSIYKVNGKNKLWDM